MPTYSKVYGQTPQCIAGSAQVQYEDLNRCAERHPDTCGDKAKYEMRTEACITAERCAQLRTDCSKCGAGLFNVCDPAECTAIDSACVYGFFSCSAPSC